MISRWPWKLYREGTRWTLEHRDGTGIEGLDEADLAALGAAARDSIGQSEEEIEQMLQDEWDSGHEVGYEAGYGDALADIRELAEGAEKKALPNVVAD